MTIQRMLQVTGLWLVFSGVVALVACAQDNHGSRTALNKVAPNGTPVTPADQQKAGGAITVGPTAAARTARDVSPIAAAQAAAAAKIQTKIMTADEIKAKEITKLAESGVSVTGTLDSNNRIYTDSVKVDDKTDLLKTLRTELEQSGDQGTLNARFAESIQSGHVKYETEKNELQITLLLAGESSPVLLKGTLGTNGTTSTDTDEKAREKGIVIHADVNCFSTKNCDTAVVKLQKKNSDGTVSNAGFVRRMLSAKIDVTATPADSNLESFKKLTTAMKAVQSGKGHTQVKRVLIDSFSVAYGISLLTITFDEGRGDKSFEVVSLVAPLVRAVNDAVFEVDMVMSGRKADGVNNQVLLSSLLQKAQLVANNGAGQFTI